MLTVQLPCCQMEQVFASRMLREKRVCVSCKRKWEVQIEVDHQHRIMSLGFREVGQRRRESKQLLID